MQYQDAALFIQVVEAGSFTAAAEALGVPKSSVSRRIASLEDDLGARLLQRTTRKLTLTDAGRDFFERVRSHVVGLEEAATAVRESGAEPRGVIRMTAPTDADSIGLGEAIATFVARHPRIHVELTLTSRVVDLVGEGFDLAMRAGVLHDSTLVARKVGATDLGLFAAPSYLDRRGRPKTLQDLGTHDCILLRAHGGRATMRLLGPTGEESVEVHGPIAADHMAFVTQTAVAGAGIALLPFPGIHDHVHAGRLEMVLPEYRLTGGGLYLVLPTSAFVPARVALLRDHLFAILSEKLERATAQCRKDGASCAPPGVRAVKRA